MVEYNEEKERENGSRTIKRITDKFKKKQEEWLYKQGVTWWKCLKQVKNSLY